ncbi:acyltransferase domain-containing protein [Kitasatospora sp. KL5]|uniref:acyltransferase domain-containing protein n=1 Tax=Kitasatospora sp. KL5 TaxID=3425125 RepID=UPI003D6F5273
MTEPGLPPADGLPAALLDLGVPHLDINQLVAVRTRLARDRGLRRIFEEALEPQSAAVGTLGRPAGLPPHWPEADGAVGRYLPALLFVALAPRVLAWHRTLGIPPEVSRSTLADLGRQLTVYRRRHAEGGLGAVSWLTLPFRGELYQLGRLQFQRYRLRAEEAPAGGAPAAGEWCLNLHVPDFCGPLGPGACDRSLAAARAFFPRYFPAEPYRAACIFSWLLDGQLARYLPEDANIVRFQRRFRPLRPNGAPSDDDPLRFVFDDPGVPPARLPRDTALRRALADHLCSGGHWYVGSGWFPL